MTEGVITTIVGATGAVVGSFLTFVVNMRRVRVDEIEVLRRTMNDISSNLNREIGRLDEVCRKQQEEIERQDKLIQGLEASIRNERQAKHDCHEKLHVTTNERDEARSYALRLRKLMESHKIPVPLPPYEVNNA